MDTKAIVIIGLLLFGFYWYNNPEAGKDKIDSGIDQVKSIIGNAGTACNEEYNPVCAANTTYNNPCLAQKAGFMNMTLGLCP